MGKHVIGRENQVTEYLLGVFIVPTPLTGNVFENW
jgi:hypothetical protein